MNKSIRSLLAIAIAALLLAGCQAQEAQAPATKEAAKPAVAVRGVDMDKKVIRIGVLNDESGPAAAIGKPFAIGKRMLAAQVNAGGSGLLPDGWKVELIERDHGYNPGKSEQAYKEIKDQVLFIGTSFGTPNTLPLRPFLKQDNMVAFPASLSSEMANFELTPPVGASYEIEAMRAMDWVVETVGADKARVAIVYDQNDYGKDGHAGLVKAAAHHNVSLVAEQTIAPGQKDFTAVVAALKKAGATHVLLTVLPSATGVILGTAAKMQYMPTWVGNTPSWVDPFFAHPQLPPAVFANYHWVTGLTYWGEDVPGMKGFLDAFAKYGQELGRPDFYIFVSYAHGLAGLAAVSAAIKNNDLSPDGFYKALRATAGFNAGGLTEPMDFSKFPYQTGTRTRILKPDFAKKTWTVTAGFAEPKALAGAVAAAGANQ